MMLDNKGGPEISLLINRRPSLPLLRVEWLKPPTLAGERRPRIMYDARPAA